MIRRGESGWVDVRWALWLPGGVRSRSPTGEHREQDAGDHKGPPFPTPPPSPPRILMSFFRLMRIGRPLCYGVASPTEGYFWKVL